MKRPELLRLIGCAPGAVAAFGPAAVRAASEAIAVVGVPSEDMTDIYYAIKTQMFARKGLDVSLVAASSGGAATAAVVAGTYQVGKSSLLALFNAHLAGIPLVAIAPDILNEPQNPRSLLQIAPDSPYKTGADLNGKTIGVPALGDATTLAIRAWVDKTGGDWHSLKFVEIPNAALEAALVAHRVDAAILQTPQLDISLEAGATKTLAYANEAIAPTFILAGYVALADWVKSHAAEARTFASTLAVATAYVNTHRPETAPLVAEFTKASLANVAKMHRTTNPTTLDPALVQPLIDAAAKYGIIARAFPARDIIWRQ
ncbi:MAG: ABC transporter substrate-binding protein [Candidatus Lustribacter sp.]|jgi:NitT/TauT family transport system substrate-binding protein